jgi:glucose/arabinose dehydrogenase
MHGRILALAAGCVALCSGVVVEAGAATGPPAPKAYGSASTAVYATGLKNPTSFAWGDGAMFAGDSGNSEGIPNGGLYVVKAGSATELPGGPLYVAGLDWHQGALYLSAAFLVKGAPSFQIDRWSGFNGTNFAKKQVLFTGSKKFQGFDGIAFGPDGRLYAGVAASGLNNNDHGPATVSPYLYDILSMNANGKDVKVFASGIRQPWQMVFAPGSRSPFVSDLGQDGPKSVEKKNPPDFLLKVKQGDDYGFPDCNWTKGSPCSSDAKPFAFFPAHTSIMGVAIIGKTLYLGSFTGEGGNGGGALYATPVAGGKVTPVVIGFPLATDALAAHDGNLYVGGSTQSGKGEIYEVKP